MLITKRWNEVSRIEECFYESQNVFYSSCYDKIDDYKQLTIVFKNGAQYVYNDIDVNDYIMFRNAQSQGKALNEFITIKRNGKAKYIYQRLTPVDVDDYRKKLDMWINEDKKVAMSPADKDIPGDEPENTNVILEIGSDSYVVKAGDTVIAGFDTADLGRMSLLLDTLRINYTKTFIKH